MKRNWVALAAFLALTAGGARAALIASDDFSSAVYGANGTSVNGLSGGSGWNASYAATGSVLMTSGLSYGSLTTAGSAIQYATNATLSNGGRSYGPTLSSGTYWYSFLVQPGVGARGTFSPFMASNSNQNGLGIRIDVTGTPGSQTTEFKAWNVAQSAGATISRPNVVGQTFLIIGKAVIDTGGNSTNQIWLGESGAVPADEAALSGFPTSFNTQGAANSALLVHGWGGRAFGNLAGFTSNNITYDEMKVGTTFSDLFPSAAVPEPSSLLLFAFPLLGGGWIRRRLRKG